MLHNLNEEQLGNLFRKIVREELKDLQQPIESKLLSIKELSKYAGVSELTIRNWIKEGKVEAKRIGGRILIEQTQFDAGLSVVKSLKYKR
jgi:excisionase family DNA binding protein